MTTQNHQRQPKLFVGICNSQTHVSSEFAWSLMYLQKTSPLIMRRSEHPWDVVRNNKLIKWFLDSDCDIFVKMDVDQVYPPDYFKVMVPLVEKYKLIGPLIYDRANGFKPLAFSNHDYPYLIPFELECNSGVIEIPYPHTNLFYSRETLENIPKPWYEAYLSEDGFDRANHVDYTFLDKVKAQGFPIFINLDVVVQHHSQVLVGRGFSETWNCGIKDSS